MKRLPLLAALVLVGALVAWTHAPILKAQAYCLDDVLFVRDNPLVTHPGWASTQRFFREVLHPSTVKGYYLPLSMTSLMVDYAIGRSTTDLTVYHRTSLILHVACSLLVLLVVYRLFGSVLAAAIAALLFGLHPQTVEPVAWIGERKTLLATLFALGSILTYVESVRRPSRAWRAASLGLFVLAMLSKPTVVPLPLLLLLLDAWPLRRISARAWLEKWPYFLLALGSAVITLISHERSAGVLPMTWSDLALWPLRSSYLLAFYLGKLVRPVDLTPIYVPPTPFLATNPVIVAMIGAVIALTVVLLVLRRRLPGALMAWVYFILALAPTLGLVQYSWVIASDKYVYFAVLGILIAIGAGLSAVWRGAPRPVQASVLALIAVVLLLEARGVRAAQRPWHDSMALSRHMEEFAPAAPAVLNRLGATLGEQGRLDQAVGYLRKAIRIAPAYTEARFNLGFLLANQGRYEEAIPELETAQLQEPDDAEAACLLGVLNARTGRLPQAEDQYRRAMRLKPDFLEPLNQLGGLLVVQGRAAEGAELFRRALALAPGNPDIEFRLGSALVMSRRSSDAVAPLRAAIRARPSWVDALNALAWLKATDPEPSVRDTAEALTLATRAAQLTGRRDPRVLDTLAAAEAAAGRFDQALHTAAGAIDLAYEQHSNSIAEAIESRRALYKAHTPYVETAAARAQSTR